MTSEVIIDVQPKEIAIALLEDKSLVGILLSGQHLRGKSEETDART